MTPPVDGDHDGFALATDCDDSDPDQYPGADEVCNGEDDDCDTAIDEEAIDAWPSYMDKDGDSYGDSTTLLLGCALCASCVLDGGDCDDTDPAVFPDAEELCNGTDDDCDAAIDEDFDLDADGFTTCAGDCDDAAATINPAASETCNHTDDDCNGVIDDGFDTDDDGFTTCDGDCDDDDPGTYPGAADVCDDTDNDCDGAIDGGDADQDGQAAACGDCQDQDATVYTGALEVPYDGIDQDCDGADLVDVDGDGYDGGVGGPDCADDDPSIHPGAQEIPYDGIDQDCDYADLVDVDGDGYAGDGFGDDCNDQDPAINPSALEVCDGIDNDCDGATDEDLLSVWYQDADGDTFGDPASPVAACAMPDDTVANALDCDDTDPNIYPGSASECTGMSCQELVDIGAAGATGTYWIDFSGQPVQTLCDFSFEGEGWTLVFSDDFENGVDPGWSYRATYLCAEWSTILGGYGNIAAGEMSITIDLHDIIHTSARIQLQYIKLDSWDGELAYVRVDGQPIWQANLYYWEGSEVCGWYRDGWLEGAYDDRHDIDVTLDQVAGTLLFTAGSQLNQSPEDESFGIDNVKVWIR